MCMGPVSAHAHTEGPVSVDIAAAHVMSTLTGPSVCAWALIGPMHIQRAL